MSETGQPGAATPGEHGDGTGRQDDSARSGGGWAPPGTGWSGGADAPAYRETVSPWHRSEPTGWGASSPRYGDLPAPLPDPRPDGEPAPRNGRSRANGMSHPGEEAPAGRAAPVSAPPTASAWSAPDPRHDVDADRLAVPLQRPAPETGRPADPDAGAARHSSDVPPRSGGWSEGSLPSSAPPDAQLPPVGTAASGFEVPPGFRAPRDRAETGPPTTEPPSWADRAEAGPTATEPPSWADRLPPESVGEEPAAVPPTPGRPADEPDWSGPSWNRPSWGGSWAPPWAREEEPPPGRRPRGERPAEWSAEPARPYEPVRAEPARPYQPVRAETPRPYEPVRAETPRPYEVTRSVPESRPEPVGRSADRPTWADSSAQSPAGVASRSEPPADAPAGGPPVDGGDRPTEAPTERAGRPVHLRSVPAAPAAGADLPGHPPTPAGSGAATATATSGPRRLDPTSPAPVPTSAPPYAARRSAPEPLPVADPVPADGTPGQGAAVLPQRVPAEPDVPVVPEPPTVDPPAETPELARIATHLRRDDEPAPPRERPEGFDVNAILDAVREVAGVRDAALRRTPAGAHSLRLDLADGADAAEVSRLVARLLQERMGLAAAPQNLPGAPAPAPVRRRSAPGHTAEPRPPESRPRASSGAESGAAAPGADARPPEPGSVPAGRSRLSEPPERADRTPGGIGSGPGGQPVGPGPEEEPDPVVGVPRRRRTAVHRGRASVEEPAGASPGSPVTLGTSYSGGQMTTTETAPSRPLETGGVPGPRVVIDHVQVSTFGLDATVEVRLLAGEETAAGHATGPAVDGYVLRLCAVAAAAAVDRLLRGDDGAGERGRCFVEHAAVVPFGNCEVATVVVLLVCEGWVEQLAGSALVAGDPRQAVVRATLAAVNRRLEALLA
ncbi:hypothetical protein [Micromonospora sp. KC723]|uniref:hypothetical protein n=1 Tax=Micromonospora sp. KC723 TaxID=2530381 RepID=UPI001042D06D|nr:hypothetical protein [Micromonospora sp. KC723]TDB75919.1 hypothetical protein E1165_09130 [Micromonospora sp. KC723]